VLGKMHERVEQMEREAKQQQQKQKAYGKQAVAVKPRATGANVAQKACKRCARKDPHCECSCLTHAVDATAVVRHQHFERG
jgi:hypothetical protein